MGRIYIWICTNSPLPFPAFSQVSQPRGEVQKLYFTLDFDLVEDILDQGLGDSLGYIFSMDRVFLNIGGKSKLHVQVFREKTINWTNKTSLHHRFFSS